VALPIWHPEIVVDEATARALIRSQFPNIDAGSVEPLGFGYDNTAFLVDGTLVFRFPRRTIAVALIEREVTVLPAIAPMLPLPIPVPVYVGIGSEAFPWPFAGYERVAGVNASALELSTAQRADFARPLGEFLRALHAIEPSGRVRDALPGDLIGRLDSTRCLPLATERLAELEAAGLVSDSEPFIDYLVRNIPSPCKRPRLVHGDLYARHLLLDDRAHLHGVIDWGDTHLGDPALDLSIVVAMLPRSARDVFEGAYGLVEPEVWKRARYRAIYHSVMVAFYGKNADDPEMLRIGLSALENLRTPE
jgi:aminoglycoside phosphotransferase (APT) family kinase protein